MDHTRPSVWRSSAWSLSRCQVCGRWPAQPVCAPCVERFLTSAARCPRCALRLPPGVDASQPCGACLTHPPPWRTCACVVDYAYPWHALIHRFKYRQEPAWAHTFARLARGLAPDWLHALADSSAPLVPVPLATDRLVQRGYNQAALWAAALVRAGPPTQHPAADRCLPDALLRLGETTELIGRTRAERFAAVRSTFIVHPTHQAALQGREVWLVDDVVTTGATAQAATEALLRAGVASVRVVCMARTPSPDDT